MTPPHTATLRPPQRFSRLGLLHEVRLKVLATRLSRVLDRSFSVVRRAHGRNAVHVLGRARWVLDPAVGIYRRLRGHEWPLRPMSSRDSTVPMMRSASDFSNQSTSGRCQHNSGSPGVEREKPFEIFHLGECIGRYCADLMVAKTLIVYLKSGPLLDPEAIPQLLNYLNVTGLPLGLVLFFGPRPKVKRVIRDSTREYPIISG